MSDKKIGVDVTPQDGIIDYYNADVITANDYYPFGMQMPGRRFAQANTNYRYGFNGKEMDNEVKGSGNQYDYGFRIFDPRLGRFLSVDPLTIAYPYYTPYQYAGNKPVWCIDLDGLEETMPQQPKKIPVLTNVSESTCIGCAQRAMNAKIIEAQLHTEKLAAEYKAWASNPENLGKPLPPQYAKVAPKASTTTISQGGVLGSDEYKIVKARYDLYGKYLPGVSDIDDGLTFIGNVKDGNYKAAAFTALFFLPGGDFLKPLKNLKGAGKLGGTACLDYAKSFMSKYGKKIEEAGGTIKKMEINMGSGVIGAGIGAESKQLSNTGLHQFIEVTDKSGAAKIFDNAHPDGILKSDYLKSISGSNATDGVMEGAKLYEKYAKEAIK